MEVKQMQESGVFPRKQVKADVNRAATAILVNLAILYMVSIAYIVVKMVWVAVKETMGADNLDSARKAVNAAMSDEFILSLAESGTPYLIAIVLGIFFVWLIMRKKASFKTIFKSTDRMNWKSFLMCLCVFMGIQLPISLLDILVESCLNAIGLTAQAGMEMATAGSTTITMFLYISFGAPIAEEIICRGFIMRGLEKYGKIFAIVVSSIIFGLMHANLTQSVYAMIVGLVLGYVAMKYSLKWAIILHSINNFLFGEVMVFVMKGLDEELQGMIETGIFGMLFVLGVVVVIVKRKMIIQYIRENLGAKEHYQFAFTSAMFLVFVIGCSLAGLLVIQKL